MPVSAETVRWAYRLFLDREVESEESLNFQMRVESTAHLRYGMLRSGEFKDRNPDLFARLPLSAPRLEVEAEATVAQRQVILERVASAREKLGEEEPYWSSVVEDRFRSVHMPTNRESFYAEGAADVDLVEAILNRVGRSLEGVGKAVEFGCGAGRTSIHLARRVSELIACDISPSHLRLAKEAATASGVGNARFEHGRLPDYGIPFGIDLWVSKGALAYCPPPIIADVLKRAFTCLNRGGIALFQVPTYQMGYSFSVEASMASSETIMGSELHCLPQPIILELARVYGLTALEVREYDGVGIEKILVMNSFALMKR